MYFLFLILFWGVRGHVYELHHNSDSLVKYLHKLVCQRNNLLRLEVNWMMIIKTSTWQDPRLQKCLFTACFDLHPSSWLSVVYFWRHVEAWFTQNEQTVNQWWFARQWWDYILIYIYFVPSWNSENYGTVALVDCMSFNCAVLNIDNVYSLIITYAKRESNYE